MPETPFRSFSPGDFYATSSWLRLADILKGNGGCYGLYGPRGAGKSWLMLRAIAEANGKRGLGLWFPCPSYYDPSEFLAALADNLAKAIERRFLPSHAWTQAIRGLRLLLASIAGFSVIVSVVAYLVRDTTGKGGKGTIFSAIPGHVWLVAEIAVGLLAALYVGQLAWNSRPAGRLAREATALRERIRYTASLKLGTEVTVGAGSSVTGSLRRARERELDERPTTVASLVFDFRNLAELMAEIVPGPVVIGIDELDKIGEPQVVRALLRDVKGIFEISGVHFLVSVSEEAATSLQLGPLQPDGRNEFDSSFYTVIDLPPLSPDQTRGLLESRKIQMTGRRTYILCLLGAGNWREIIRLAERAISFPEDGAADQDRRFIMAELGTETLAMIDHIIGRAAVPSQAALPDSTKIAVWNALPPAAFTAAEKFAELSKRAIHEHWQPGWSDAAWDPFVELWQRLLVRLFIAGSVIECVDRCAGPAEANALIIDLRNIAIMASRSPGVAKAMLAERFGSDLASPYRNTAIESGVSEVN